jgi:hypothetical protein
MVISSQRKCQPVIFLSLIPFLYKPGVFSHAFFIFGKYDGNVDLLLVDVGALVVPGRLAKGADFPRFRIAPKVGPHESQNFITT